MRVLVIIYAELMIILCRLIFLKKFSESTNIEEVVRIFANTERGTIFYSVHCRRSRTSHTSHTRAHTHTFLFILTHYAYLYVIVLDLKKWTESHCLHKNARCIHTFGEKLVEPIGTGNQFRFISQTWAIKDRQHFGFDFCSVCWFESSATMLDSANSSKKERIVRTKNQMGM